MTQSFYLYKAESHQGVQFCPEYDNVLVSVLGINLSLFAWEKEVKLIPWRLVQQDFPYFSFLKVEMKQSCFCCLSGGSDCAMNSLTDEIHSREWEMAKMDLPRNDLLVWHEHYGSSWPLFRGPCYVFSNLT